MTVANLQHRLARRTLLALATVLAALAVLATVASRAEAAAGWWSLESNSAPTTFQPGHKGELLLSAIDIGDAPVSGASSPVKIVDHLPPGLTVEPTVVETNPAAKIKTSLGLSSIAKACTVEGSTVTCELAQDVPTFEPISVLIRVEVSPSFTEGTNSFTIEGGGLKGESASSTVKSSATQPGFGIESYQLLPEAEGGAPETQAGSHPFQLTTNLAFNGDYAVSPNTGELEPKSPQLLHDLVVKLPPGLVGDANPEAIPQCSESQFATIEPNGNTNECPAETAVGVANVAINEPFLTHYTRRTVPVFSLKPAPGEPARFGFEVLKLLVTLDTSVLTGGDYSVVTTVSNTSQGANILSSQLTFWGEPGDESHDESRGWHCLVNGGNEAQPNPTHEGCVPKTRPSKAFLQMPTSCRTAWRSTVQADSWQERGLRDEFGNPLAGDERWKSAEYLAPPLGGCENVPFSPSISVQPEQHSTNTPTGLTVDLHLPQESTLALHGISEAAIRESTVTLPQGVLLNPSAANGLEACPTSLVGYRGARELEAGSGLVFQTFTPTIPEGLALQPGVNFCSNGSKVGVVHVRTPDLPNEIEGGVYLAEQNANPFGSLFAMYILAEDPVSHVTVKLAGEITIDPNTGRITTTFKNTPPVPFEDLKLELFGGSRASITTPALCGNYSTSASFVPWSSDTPVPVSSAPFTINTGAEGSGCSSPQPLAPGFSAGSTNPQAGAYTSFELTLTHRDRDQAPDRLSMTLPKGVAATIKNVAQCPEAQAVIGTCGPQSLIGHATAVAGLGGTPFTQTGGRVYLTGPLKGGGALPEHAPFGLSVVIPAKAGPFDFGNVVTLSTLQVDPNTAQAIITSELPTFVNTLTYRTGVPVQLKEIHVVVDRPQFQFNPTNCTPSAVTGALHGVGGTTAPLASRFGVTGCAALPFKPEFKISTEKAFSKVDGASFTVTVKAHPGEANITETHIVIPSSLPSRLTTIQKACPDTTFEANPATCPEGSVIGEGIAHTPVLNSVLRGPAYLVSHGNRSFPDVEFVLEGEGVKLVLDGETFIHNGVTTSTFSTVPDAPVETFEAILPRGPHSALAAYLPGKSNLCGSNLTVPTKLRGQNGVVIEQTTKVAVTGCPRVKGFKKKKESALQKALKKCRKKHNRHQRAVCERAARKKFGHHHKSSSHHKH